MPKVSVQEIQESFIEVMSKIEHDKKATKSIKEKMREYKYLAGDVQGYISNAKNKVESMDTRTICLMLEVTFDITKIPQSMPEHYFTESEMQTSRQYTGDFERPQRIKFPLTIDNVFEISKDMYSTFFDAKLIKELLDSLLIHYNFQTQREGTVKIRKDQVIYEPTVNQANIAEMTELILEGKLIPKDTLVFNAGVKTNKEYGFEIDYNEEKNQLTILNGTKLDVVDGYHRCKAIQNALEKDPSISYKFPVLITNFTDMQAQTLLSQMSKATPISKVRLEEFNKDKLSNNVVTELKKWSELSGKISQTEHVNYKAGEVVTFKVLSDTIDEVFEIKNKAQEVDTVDYLTDFFNYLIGSFDDEFVNKVSETHAKSLINDNNMFSGYIVLAKRMQEEEIRFTKVKSILSSIDFSRENKLWEELNILNDGKLTKNARENIKNYFNKIELKEKVL